MKQRKSYQEQKEILKNKREALRQGKVQKLVMNASIDSGKERAIKRELDTILDSLAALSVLVLTPIIIPLFIIPIVLFIIISFIIVIKELLVSTVKLLTLPLKRLCGC